VYLNLNKKSLIILFLNLVQIGPPIENEKISRNAI